MEVVAMADKIAARHKCSLQTSKKVLRAAYRHQLPSYLFLEPKRGWQSPGAKWFRDPEILAYVREVFSSSYYNGLDGLFDWNNVQDMLTEHVDAKNYYLYPLWKILQLQAWSRKNNIKIL